MTNLVSRMRRIPLPTVDDQSTFDKIRAAKQRARRKPLLEIRTGVFDAYESYQESAPEVGQLEKMKLTVSQKEALTHTYTVDTDPLATLRSEILGGISVVRCPFCGIGESSTIDHYLPKEIYPEFSIYSKNLVPSCGYCNNRKRTQILEAGTDIRMFLHPYYDRIPTLDFLSLRVKMEDDALILTFRVTRPQGMKKRVFSHIDNHFRSLGLADRYRKMSFDHLGGWYPALRRAYGQQANAMRVSKKLLEMARDSEEARGPNFWHTKLYLALSSCKEFCDGGFEVIKPLRL